MYTPFSGYSEDSRGTVTTYLTLNGSLVGAYTYQKGNEASTGKLTFVATNYLGTPVLETDDKGDIVQMDITDVFGNYVQRDQRKDNAYHNKGYTSHEFDDVTGLTYVHARYLDTTSHSFLSVDPIIYSLSQDYLLDPQQMNSYIYARNNPIVYKDPNGQWIESGLDIAALAYDLNELREARENGTASWKNYAYIAGDGVGLALPGVTGVGLGMRAVGRGDDAYKAFNGAKQIIGQASENISKNTGFIQITKDSIQHVVDRHAWNSPAKDASKLAKGVDPVALINKAKDITPTIQARTGNLERVVTSKVNIGTNLTKQTTNVYTVITKKMSDGIEKLITMFPGLPKKK